MDDDDSAASLFEVVDLCGLVIGEHASIGAIHDEHVGLLQLFWGGELEGTVDFHAARAEEERPFFEEARVVVLVGTVGFCAGPDEDADGVCRDGAEGVESEERESEGAEEVAHGGGGLWERIPSALA